MAGVSAATGSSASGGDQKLEYDQPSLNNEPNVVPMADVMLVLLIIFMIVTPTILQGFQANLPVGDNLLSRPEDESRVVVGIDVEGNYYFNKRPIARENMLNAMTSAFAERPEDKVLYLKAHSGLPYADILAMMELGRDAGARVLAAVSESTVPPEEEE
jgi:biopolymer transport protein ExbD